MLGKSLLIGLAVAPMPFWFFAAPQSAVGADAAGPQDAIAAPDPRSELEATVERLRARLHATQQRAQNAEDQVGDLKKQLQECLDMLVHCSRYERRSCTPSRSRALLTHYQWMRERGHDDRAKVLLARVVEGNRNDNGRLNRMAWDLMTDDDSAGKYDRLALDIVDHMLQRERRLSHAQLDTAALAKFLNGQVDEAIRLQKKALEENSGSDDYRRRLRTYQAAKAKVAEAPRRKLISDE